jgi:hypothetical protein
VRAGDAGGVGMIFGVGKTTSIASENRPGPEGARGDCGSDDTPVAALVFSTISSSSGEVRDSRSGEGVRDGVLRRGVRILVASEVDPVGDVVIDGVGERV